MPQDMYSFYKVVDVIKNILKLLKTETFLIDKKLFNLSSLKTSISKLSKTIKEKFNIKVCSTIPNDQFSVNFFNKGVSNDIDECEEGFFDSLDNLTTILGIFDKMIKKKNQRVNQVNIVNYMKLIKVVILLKLQILGKKLRKQRNLIVKRIQMVS